MNTPSAAARQPGRPRGSGVLPDDNQHESVNVRMPKALLTWLRELARAERRPFSAQLVYMLEKAKERDE